MDTISRNAINPSLAYKNFNFDYIDCIWMEYNGQDFNIFYKRDKKYKHVGVKDYESGKGFSITGYPNPFKDQLTINIEAKDLKEKPVIEIYNSNSQLVKILNPDYSSMTEFSYLWNGTNQHEEKISPGVYIIMCSLGNVRTARKVIYIK
jgi:flagellar hook assembly protein FlgD